jgi:Tfp pilus assembly protein PilN
MQDIDFLPVEYRQKHARRQTQPWRVVVVVVFVGLLVTATLALQGSRRAAEKHLAAVQPQYDLTVAQSNTLGNTQTQLQLAHAKAELVTYLRHPWPKSQILSALLTPLPEEVTLRELQVFSERRVRPQGMESRSRAQLNSETDTQTNLSPAQLDLKDFREKFDNSQITVLLDGTTSDSAALHSYLGKLDAVKLFSNVELRSVESVDAGSREGAGLKKWGTMQFQAAVTVRPGYGQPGGPEGLDGMATAKVAKNIEQVSLGGPHPKLTRIEKQ